MNDITEYKNDINVFRELRQHHSASIASLLSITEYKNDIWLILPNTKMMLE